MIKSENIPSGWQSKNLSYLIKSMDAGISVNSEDRRAEKGEYGVLKTSAVTSGFFNSEENKAIVVSEIKRAKVSPIKDRIIISRMNTPALVGANAYVPETRKDLFLPDRLWQLEPKSDHVNMRWLSFVLGSPKYRLKLSSIATGTSNSMKNITKEDVMRLQILLPPLHEQKSIADLLSIWDDAIEKTQKLIRYKEKKTKRQIQKIISQRCGSWAHVKPQKIFDTITEKDYPNEELLSVTQDRGVIPRSKLEGRVMSPDGTTSSYKLIKPGDFAISLRSFQGGIEYSNYQGIISPAYTVLRPKIELVDDFYRLFFKSYIFIEKYLNLSVIGIRDGKQISIPDFLNIPIPLPPLNEQNEIAETLILAQHEINLLRQLREKYKTQKRGLMQKMLTGQWRIKSEHHNKYAEVL